MHAEIAKPMNLDSINAKSAMIARCCNDYRAEIIAYIGK